jgi:hypothetical protein
VFIVCRNAPGCASKDDVSSVDIDLEFRFDQAAHEADLRGDETRVPLQAVENTLEPHPAAAPAKGLTKQPHRYRTTP